MADEPSREESAAAIDLLESVIEEVPDDHPARADTLVRLGGLLITRGFSLDRPVPSLKKLRRQLEDTIKRPAASALNDAINHCLLTIGQGSRGAPGAGSSGHHGCLSWRGPTTAAEMSARKPRAPGT